MKKVFLTFFIMTIFHTSYAKIIQKPGILDFEKLSNSFKELEAIRKKLNQELNNKILLKNSIIKSLNFIEKGKVIKNQNLIEKTLSESTILSYKERINAIETEEKRVKIATEKNSSFIEVKKKMIKFITTTKIKWGFGIIIQNEPEVILFMDRYADFNRIIDEELKSSKGGEE